MQLFFKKGILLPAFMIILFTVPVIANAQGEKNDTLKLSIPEAEKLFLQNNLPLLAAKYNIDANKALIQQAKLWDNPVLVTDQNVYDGKFFRHKTEDGQQYGQVYIQVQQLIRTAGKRSKLAQLAADNTTISQQQFDDILRSLRYLLQSDFVETVHLLKIKNVYDGEITEVDKLVKGMNEVYKLGDISLKENMRLKALLFSLQNELININAQLIPLQNEIKLLLQSAGSSFIQPALTYHLPDLITASLPGIDSLVNIANSNRPDVQMAKTQLIFQQHNLVYQKALAKPDITVAPEFDRLNSYQPNYVGLSVSLPLNLFNKNQGNIKSASFSIKQQEVQLHYQTDKIRNEVNTAFEKAKYYQGINNREQLTFSENYEQLFQNVLKSYQARQISLLDFTDFLDSYKDTKLKLIEQHIGLVKALAELNYTINQTITKL
jgi:outer membrane protein, heavy metal efflux system